MPSSDNLPSGDALIHIATVFAVGLPAVVEEVKYAQLPFDEHVRQIRSTYGQDIEAEQFARMIREAVADANRP